jgi:hypothetical protein
MRTRIWLGSSYDNTIMNHRQEDIEILILHPHGDLWVPLDEWIRNGPGPRPLLSPTAAREKDTQQSLPIEVIPMQYRNTEESRRLIEKGSLFDPWPQEQGEGSHP